MITVAGFNTAIDRRIDIDTLQPGSVQRALSAHVVPGGKGLHVAQTATALGEPARLVGLSDEAHAHLLREHLHTRGVDWRGIRSPHDLRQCLAIHEADGRVTEILESGAELDVSVREALLSELASLIDGSHALVLSGSLPRGFDAETYARLIRQAAACNMPCLLDASGEALSHGVDAKPWLVKPNADEAAALWGKPVQTIDDALACARWLYARGIARAVVTLGADGAVGFDGRQAWHACLAVTNVRNSVGSGDCFMAGLAVSAVRGRGLDETLRWATACGAANAQDEETGHVRKDRVDDLYAKVQVRQLGN